MTPKPFQLTHNPDLSFRLSGTILKNEIDRFHTQALTKLQQKLNLPGFRPGKAPLNLVSSNYDQSTILSETINIGLTEIYSKLLVTHQLKPVIPPHVEFVTSPTLSTDWDVVFNSCLEPKVTLKPKYFDALKQIKAVKDRQKNVDSVLEVIEKNSSLVFPQLLADHEWEHYSQDKSIPQNKLDSAKNEYTENLKKQWTINLALNQIGKDHKIQLMPKDLENVSLPAELIKNNPQLAVHLLLQDKIVAFLIENLSQA